MTSKVKGGHLFRDGGSSFYKRKVIVHLEDSRESPRDRYGEKALSEVRLPRVASSRREDAYRLKPQSDNNGSGVIILDKHVNGSVRLRSENLERKRDKGDSVVIQNHPSIGSIAGGC
ncbi:hypothetical protein Tco_0810289, partial [Tanacetum coccineum]